MVLDAIHEHPNEQIEKLLCFQTLARYIVFHNMKYMFALTRPVNIVSIILQAHRSMILETNIQPIRK